MDDELLTVLHGAQDLGADVVWGSHCHVALDGAVLRQPKTGAKVSEADVSGSVDQHIIRLDVSVDVAQVVD